MDSAVKMIRERISKMPPKEAIEYIKSFELPEEEELFIIERDVRRKSIVSISDKNAVSVETVSRRRHDGYAKIAASKSK